jgi:AraC-like DNA-binding protein
MGTTKFKRFFKRTFGMSCYQYHLRARMNFAKELLDSGLYTASEVAFRVGYLNQGHFSKIFKLYYNSLPSEYRRNILVKREMEEQYS